MTLASVWKSRPGRSTVEALRMLCWLTPVSVPLTKEALAEDWRHTGAYANLLPNHAVVSSGLCLFPSASGKNQHLPWMEAFLCWPASPATVFSQGFWSVSTVQGIQVTAARMYLNVQGWNVFQAETTKTALGFQNKATCVLMRDTSKEKMEGKQHQ